MVSFTIINGVLYNYNKQINDKEAVVPDGVTKIDAYAFRGGEFERIVLPEGLKTIGHNAFQNCSRLISITIPDSVIEIGDEAFLGCDGLADQNGYIIVRGILFGVAQDSESAINGDYYIPEGVTRIGGYAFRACNHDIKKVHFPASLKEIDELAFWNRLGLKKVEIPNGVTRIGKECFKACYDLKSVVIPESVQMIGENAFDECPLEVMYAPGTPITGIEGTKMKMLAVNNFLRDPDRYKNAEVAASYRKYLIAQKKKWLPEILKKDRVDLLQIYVDAKKVTSENIDEEYLKPAMEEKATQCTAYLLEMKNRLSAGTKHAEKRTSLEADPFSPAEMKKLWAYETREDGTIELTDYKGAEAEIVVPERVGKTPVTKIGSYLFSPGKPRRKKAICETLRKIKKVMIPEGVTEIGANAFSWNSGITKIAFPASLQRIEDEAFYYCVNLSADTISDDVLKDVFVGRSAFCGCNSMANVDGYIVFQQVLYACDGGVKNATVPAGVEAIASGAFSDCLLLKSVVIPQSVKQIAEDAFYQYAQVTIHAPAGSYAEQYAKEHNIPFVAE